MSELLTKEENKKRIKFNEKRSGCDIYISRSIKTMLEIKCKSTGCKFFHRAKIVNENALFKTGHNHTCEFTSPDDSELIFVPKRSKKERFDELELLINAVLESNKPQ